MKTRVLTLTFLTLAFAASAAAAPTSSNSTTLHISAKAAGLAFSTTHLTAPHGTVSIKGNGINKKGKLVPKGATSIVTATLKKGSYTFLCTVAGHAAAGMKGKLTIT